MPYPVEINAVFIKNKKGQVTGLKWQPIGSSGLIGRKVEPHLYDEEEVKFSNGNVTLAGTLSLPLKKGRHPAVILISGSDPNTRGKGLPQFFAQHGIAALAYDKRGSGDSTGTLTGADSLNRARILRTTSAAEWPSRMIRSSVGRALSRFGGSCASQVWHACALVTTDANGWLIS